MSKNYTLFIVLFTLFFSLENIQAQNSTHLNFDGANDRVSLTSQVSNFNNFTVEAWMYTAENNIYQTIYAEGNTGDNNPMFSLTRMSGTSGFEIVLRNSSNTGLVVSTTIGKVPLNTWTHVAFVRTSATTASLYINGAKTDDFMFADPGNIVVNAANIGVRQRVAFDGWLKGNLDEVRIWNRILTMAEIQSNMNCELSTPAAQTGLVRYYKFNQGVNQADNTGITSLTDSSVMASNGTLLNFALTGATSNWLSGSVIVTGNMCSPFLSTTDFDISSNIKIYPNPAAATVTIDLLSLDHSNVEVFDSNGRKILTQQLNDNSNNINIGNLSSGMYLFKVNSDKGSAISKVVKQ